MEYSKHRKLFDFLRSLILNNEIKIKKVNFS